MKQPVVSSLDRQSGNQRYRPLEDNDEITPLPRAPWFAVLFMVASTFFSANVIIPFVPFLVHRLFPEMEKIELGTRTGFLDAAFFMGLLIGGPLWGKIGDTMGRKYALLWGVFAGIGFALAFGFCDSYALALTIRFFWGVSGGNMGMSRAILAEISDHTNRARSFTALGIGVIIGRLFGNGIGGLLAEPADKYEFFNTVFWRNYPYVLPVFVSAGINLLSLVVGAIFLPETKGRGKSPQVAGAPLMSSSIQDKEKSNIGGVLKQANARALILGCFLIALAHSIYSVIFPLWVLNDKDDYGFNFGTSAIGMTQVWAVPTDLLLQLLLFPLAVQKLGLICCYKASAVLWALCVIVTPCAWYVSESPIEVQWVVLEISVIMNNILAMVVLASNGILSANLVDIEIRGLFMGIRQSFIGLGRGIGACFGGVLFTWSLQAKERTGILSELPFNFYFGWLVQAILLFGVFGLSSYANKELERSPQEWRDYHREEKCKKVGQTRDSGKMIQLTKQTNGTNPAVMKDNYPKKKKRRGWLHAINPWSSRVKEFTVQDEDEARQLLANVREDESSYGEESERASIENSAVNIERLVPRKVELRETRMSGSSSDSNEDSAIELGAHPKKENSNIDPMPLLKNKSGENYIINNMDFSPQHRSF